MANSAQCILATLSLCRDLADARASGTLCAERGPRRPSTKERLLGGRRVAGPWVGPAHGQRGLTARRTQPLPSPAASLGGGKCSEPARSAER
eukprot:CAMPEP_0183341988 /NCGR_PEP_ID=MMETSP0164_2-20130417/8177_1 /TAXON_ID=221442 /ORGANISM="Coccolithus pelagicus ssp braarudi, Strain PLY182g" /LENGTH=91 /DNA_ID=CAMNT_0025512455 /DNA_START=267 /DNA_END=539 /DNA_ORIENTATION=-